MKLLLLLAVLGLAACTTGKELPMVRASDPTWALTPDHLTIADLPR